MADEPDNLVLEILREIRRDIARLDGKIDDVGAELRSEMHSLRADVAADLHALEAKNEAEHKQTREQIVGLRRAVVEYHCSAIGHGVLFSELEERVRRLEHHLKLPPSDAH